MKIYLPILVLWLFALGGFIRCSQEDANNFKNPDVKLFIQQIKSDRYNGHGPSGEVELPDFKKSDIPALIFYAKDHTPIKRFPVNPESSAEESGYRLSQCLLWTVEKIRRGGYPSDAPVIVKKKSDIAAGVPVTDPEEINRIWELYHNWWEKVEKESETLSVSIYYLNPLEGTDYSWE